MLKRLVHLGGSIPWFGHRPVEATAALPGLRHGPMGEEAEYAVRPRRSGIAANADDGCHDLVDHLPALLALLAYRGGGVTEVTMVSLVCVGMTTSPHAQLLLTGDPATCGDESPLGLMTDYLRRARPATINC